MAYMKSRNMWLRFLNAQSVLHRYFICINPERNGQRDDVTQIYYVFCSLKVSRLELQVPIFTRELTKYYRTLQSQNSDLLFLIKFNLTYSTHRKNRARNSRSIQTQSI